MSWREDVGLTWQERHRGPYRFYVSRPFVTKPGFYRGEWLSGIVEPEDAESEAHALLLDKRDRIEGVALWSQRENQFVMSWRKHDVERSKGNGRSTLRSKEVRS